MERGLYIHIPFCVKRCSYCNFCSYTDGDFEPYAKALTKELGIRSAKSDNRINTVYFGGGTPSLLPSAFLHEIMSAILKSYVVEHDAEITIECNPNTLDNTKVNDLVKMGFNRFSLGLQCAQDDTLALIGRIHKVKDYEKAVKHLKNAGIANISTDIMLGLPKQTKDDIIKTLDFITQFDIPHISAYALKVEKGTELYQKVKRKEVTAFDDDYVAELYDVVHDYLDSKGIKRYEISNFAKPGYESRHNLIYWTLNEYIGVGCSAHGFLNGIRYANVKSKDKYVAKLSDCKLPVSSSHKQIKENMINDYVMLSLRLDKGFALEDFEKRFGINFIEKYTQCKDLMKQNVLIIDNGRVYVDKKYTYVLNDILVKLLYC
jgi:oxygen-independent coproporphyrinogen-3 oxidase